MEFYFLVVKTCVQLIISYGYWEKIIWCKSVAGFEKGGKSYKIWFWKKKSTYDNFFEFFNRAFF